MRDDRGFVYVMRNNEDGLYLIGWCRDVWEKQKDVQTRHKGVQLITYAARSWRDEMAVHDRFAHLRERGSWYRLTPLDVEDLTERPL